MLLRAILKTCFIFLVFVSAVPAFSSEPPNALLEAQETSAEFLPRQKQFSFSPGKKPNVLSTSLVKQIAKKPRLLENLIRPAQGIWIIQNTHGESDDDPKHPRSRHLCGEQITKELVSIGKRLRELMKAEDILSCQNNVPLPYCSVGIAGEFATVWDIIFTRNSTKDLVFWGVLIRDSAYREPFLKEENALLKKLLDASHTSLCVPNGATASSSEKL